MDSTLSVIRKIHRLDYCLNAIHTIMKDVNLEIEIMGLMFYKVWNLLNFAILSNKPVLKLPVDSFQTTVRLCTD